MKNRLLSGISFVALGGLAAFGPLLFFPVCSSEEHVMRCHWSAQAELGIGLLAAVVGVVLLAVGREPIRIGLNLAMVPAGVLVLLVPTVLIGMCGMETMDCRLTALPAFTVIGVIIAAGALANAVYLCRHIEKS